MKFEIFSPKNEKILPTIEEFKTKEGDIVTLKWCVVKPKEKKKDGQTLNSTFTANDSVLFLPGVALEADSPSVLKSAQDFADASQMPTFSVTTRIDNPKTKDSQGAQAEAIRQFIASRDLRHITVVGNSQGANKSIDLVAQIEKDNEGKEDPQTSVRGVILTNPAGLYDQDPRELTGNFFKDAMVNTPAEVVKQKPSMGAIKRTVEALRLGNSVAGNIIKEAVSASGEFSDRLKREAVEASNLNKHAKDIKAPIVVVFGSKDTALGAKDIIPETAHNQSVIAQENRQTEARKIFPNSQNIKVIEASKLATHGLHYLRSSSIANASIGMIERMERNEEIEKEIAA